MEGSKLKTVLAVDANMMRTIETAIKVGDAVLLKVSDSSLLVANNHLSD